MSQINNSNESEFFEAQDNKMDFYSLKDDDQTQASNKSADESLLVDQTDNNISPPLIYTTSEDRQDKENTQPAEHEREKIFELYRQYSQNVSWGWDHSQNYSYYDHQVRRGMNGDEIVNVVTQQQVCRRRNRQLWERNDENFDQPRFGDYQNYFQHRSNHYYEGNPNYNSELDNQSPFQPENNMFYSQSPWGFHDTNQKEHYDLSARQHPHFYNHFPHHRPLSAPQPSKSFEKKSSIKRKTDRRNRRPQKRFCAGDELFVSKANGQVTLTTNVARKVEAIDPISGNRAHVFASCSEAARTMGVNRTKMSRTCRSGGGQIGDYVYRYVEMSNVPAGLIKSESSNDSFASEERAIIKYADPSMMEAASILLHL